MFLRESQEVASYSFGTIITNNLYKSVVEYCTYGQRKAYI